MKLLTSLLLCSLTLGVSSSWLSFVKEAYQAMQERAYRVSSAVDMRTPWLTRKPTDMAAAARILITTDLLACLTNTEHPPITSGGCAVGLGTQPEFFSLVP
ncbi:rCG54543, partial [Rattus norvegicus]